MREKWGSIEEAVETSSFTQLVSGKDVHSDNSKRTVHELLFNKLKPVEDSGMTSFGMCDARASFK